MKKIISNIFDIIFINFHFEKKHNIEDAKKIAFANSSRIVAFLLFVLFTYILSIVIVILGLRIYKPIVYIMVFPVALLFFLNKNLIQKYILKPNIDFSIDKYSEEYIKNNKKRNLLFMAIFALIGGGSYVIMKLLIIFLRHH